MPNDQSLDPNLAPPAQRPVAAYAALAAFILATLVALDLIARASDALSPSGSPWIRAVGWSVVITAVVAGVLMWRRRRSGSLDPVSMKVALRVFENAVEGILITDRDGRILMVNPAFTAITGYSAEEAIGATPRILRSQRHDTAFYDRMWTELLRTGQWRGEIFNRQKSGEAYPEWLSISAITDDEDRITHFVAVFHDMSEFRRREETMRYLAHHDALTGAANRLLFDDRLEHSLGQARRDGTQVGLLFLDLDNFKEINDTHGHLVGDLVLRVVAERLKEVVRDTDTVARLGGDEFAVLIPLGDDRAGLRRVVATIRGTVCRPVESDGRDITIRCSIGWAVFPDDAANGAELLEEADRAMYEAKRHYEATRHSRGEAD